MSCRASTYARALAGRSDSCRACEMSSHQPSRYSYTGLAWWNSVCVIGISSYRVPSTSYATHTGTLSSVESTSSLVTKKSVTPLTRVVYALTIPITLLIRVGPMPDPTHAPPAVGLEEVTNG